MEASAMMLDVLSRRAKRLVQVKVIIDMRRGNIRHRKLLPHLKEYLASDANETVPDLAAHTYILNINATVSSIFNIVKGSVMNEHQKNTCTLISGDPFVSSLNFADRFERSAMPADVGGELRTGEDGHCCLEVWQPALSDGDALWAKYTNKRNVFGVVRD